MDTLDIENALGGILLLVFVIGCGIYHIYNIIKSLHTQKKDLTSDNVFKEVAKLYED